MTFNNTLSYLNIDKEIYKYSRPNNLKNFLSFY